MLVNNPEIKEYLNRIERLEDEIAGLKDDVKDIYLEAKNKGYDVKILRKVVKIRKKGIEAYQAEQSELELYMAADGLVPTE
ncbi:MAG: DUF2312 domain-containing protein [Caulobacteraceae bacterium]|nr:DUF2312 domain-containing protein [Caulobacteraceae bacterium]